MAIDVSMWLAQDDLQQGAYTPCIARLRHLLRDDRWDTAAPALLIEAFVRAGDRQSARRQYQRFVQLHGQPSSEIESLARTYRL
jgi:DNA-binding SARP family transcriptional activator